MNLPDGIHFVQVPQLINWIEMKETLVEDHFDNLRTPEQYRTSFENSAAFVVAYDAHGRITGTARAISDGVCNAYIVDVWTRSDLRRRGIASEMMRNILRRLPGQHVYLFTGDAVDFYTTLGFKSQETGMGRVVGRWLDPDPAHIQPELLETASTGA
jgi:ribosomal protein S18 acetylase RimI-like enzyme